MSKRNDTSQDATAAAAGFRVGLQLWLFFLLWFIVLQYSVPLSILMGAIGGFAGGRVVAWWYSKDIPPPPPSQETEERSRDPATVTRLGKPKKDSQKKKKRSLRGTSWLFPERRTLTSKPRQR